MRPWGAGAAAGALWSWPWPCSYGGTQAAIPGHGGLDLKALSFQLATSMDLAWWMRMPWLWRPRNGWQCPRSTPVLPSLTRDPGELGSCTCTGPCWWAFGGWRGWGQMFTRAFLCLSMETRVHASVCVCVCLCACTCVYTLAVHLQMCLPFSPVDYEIGRGIASHSRTVSRPFAVAIVPSYLLLPQPEPLTRTGNS